jgi:hypothetical protein
MRPILRSILARVARSPDRERLVLRGGVLTAALCPSRTPPDDVDFVWTGAWDFARVEAVVHGLAAAGPTPMRVLEAHGIWTETPFPGLRAIVEEGDEAAQIDVGWGDPIDPPPVLRDVMGEAVHAVRPETMIAWKLHGLFEFGHGKWRPKDLYDLALLAGVPVDGVALHRATRLAFSSRGTPLESADRFLRDPSWGTSRGSRRKWVAWAKKRGLDPLPDLDATRARVRSLAIPIFREA